MMKSLMRRADFTATVNKANTQLQNVLKPARRAEHAEWLTVSTTGLCPPARGSAWPGPGGPQGPAGATDLAPGTTGRCRQVRRVPGAGGHPPQLPVPGQGSVTGPGVRPVGARARQPGRAGNRGLGGNHGGLDALPDPG